MKHSNRSALCLLAVTSLAFSLTGCGGEMEGMDEDPWLEPEATETQRAALDGGNHQGEDFRDQHMPYASFRGANVTEAHFDGSFMERADFYGATGNSATFKKSDNTGNATNLYRADFYGATFTNANFNRANLRFARLYGANFEGSTFTRANLSELRAEGADLANTNMRGADVSWAQMPHADLRNLKAQPTGSGHETSFFGAWATGADLRSANLKDSSWYLGILNNANLSGADIRGVDFRGANLNGANLCNTTRNGSIQVDSSTTQVGTQCPL